MSGVKEQKVSQTSEPENEKSVDQSIDGTIVPELAAQLASIGITIVSKPSEEEFEKAKLFLIRKFRITRYGRHIIMTYEPYLRCLMRKESNDWIHHLKFCNMFYRYVIQMLCHYYYIGYKLHTDQKEITVFYSPHQQLRKSVSEMLQDVLEIEYERAKEYYLEMPPEVINH
ncbi:hypothetical protein RF11_15805 [Thelohanellus kitauei]|uniref:Uncharacterized protein n=1 Tax=Thelohanellus kitauei TaxID=669202 RepID=A0A0C2MFN8_THEKT|nr:hypothetical protein RF11_15805 [Thelohanellus kitauei]